MALSPALLAAACGGGTPACTEGAVVEEPCEGGVRSKICEGGAFRDLGECEADEAEPEACASAEPIGVGSLFHGDRLESTDLEGSCGGAGAEKVFAFTAPASGHYRAVVLSGAPTTVHVRTVCGRADSEILCESGNTRQPRLTAVGDFLAGRDERVFIAVDFDGSPGPFSLRVLRQDGGCFGEGEHLLGQGDGVKIVVVPCRFTEDDREEFIAITDEIRDAFSDVEPYRSHPELFSLYRVADFSAAELTSDDNYICKDAAEVAAVASACPYDRVVSLAKGGELSLAGGVTAVVAVSDMFPAAVAPGVALHESGHLLGLDNHPCMDGDEPTDFVPPELANCAASQISPDEPCAEWAGQEYLDWVLPGDPPFGCFLGCANNLTLYRPWEGDVPFEGSIMCHNTRVLVPGFTPVDRKLLFDRLRYGADD
jgi:hypothetical protein